MKILVAIVFGLLSFSANAAAPNPLLWNTDYLSWTAPTACTDGGPITVCPITGYDVQVAPTVTGTFVAIGSTAATVLEFIRANVAEGANCYRVIAKSAGGNSAPSSIDCETTIKPPSIPNPPILKTIDQIAYRELNGVANKVTYAAIGTVPLGTSCLNYSSNGYMIVDRKKVTLKSGLTSLPLQVWVRCG